MIVQSSELHSTRWTLAAGDALAMLRDDATRFGTRLFSLHGRGYELRLRAGGGRRLYFEWRSLENNLQPPLAGTVEVSNLGRIAVLALNAAYAFEEDAALIILQYAVGLRPAREALRLAGSAMLSLLSRRAPAEKEEAPKQKPRTL